MRLRPSPPTAVVSSIRSMDGSELNRSTSSPRRATATLPSSRTWLTDGRCAASKSASTRSSIDADCANTRARCAASAAAPPPPPASAASSAAAAADSAADASAAPMPHSASSCRSAWKQEERGWPERRRDVCLLVCPPAQRLQFRGDGEGVEGAAFRRGGRLALRPQRVRLVEQLKSVFN